MTLVNNRADVPVTFGETARVASILRSAREFGKFRALDAGSTRLKGRTEKASQRRTFA
jgi:hypothetical protein